MCVVRVVCRYMIDLFGIIYVWEFQKIEIYLII